MKVIPGAILTALTLWVGSPSYGAPDLFDETHILQSIARKPLEMNFHSVAAHGDGVVFATSEGLIAMNYRLRTGKYLTRDPVRSVAWDAESSQWVAAGAKGLWREDAGWIQPMGLSPSAGECESVTPSAAGLLLTTQTEFLQLNGDRARLLLTDTHGFIGRPAATLQEAAILGFWALHRIELSGGSPGRTIDIPLPAALRADIPFGVTYIGRSILVIGRRSGLYILSPNDRVFPEAIRPPPTDAAHLERGFPEGWADCGFDADEVYLLHADATLHHLSVGEPARKVSRWPALAQSYRLALLPDRRVILHPLYGHSVLYADPASSEVPQKLNFLATPSGEILIRSGLPPELFTQGSWVPLLISGAGWAILAAGVCAVLAWLAIRGIPLLHLMHPTAAVFQDRLRKLRFDQSALLQSYGRTVKELNRMGIHEDRRHALTESRRSLLENMRRFAQTAKDEAQRIRAEGTPPRPGPGPKPPLVARFFRTQTRGWERQFLRIAREIESVLDETEKKG